MTRQMTQLRYGLGRTRREDQMHQAVWIASFVDEGQALQLVKAVADSHGFDAWRSLNRALKPTSKARQLALLRAATTWPAFSMSSAVQPQLLKLEEVFGETVKSGTAVQEEIKSAILLRCVGGQLESYLNLTIGDNVQYSTLREQVLQWDRSQQKWATSMVASSSANSRRAKGKGKDAKRKGKKPKGEQQKGKEGDYKGKGKGKDQKERCGELLHLWKARTSCSRLLEKQYSTGCK